MMMALPSTSHLVAGGVGIVSIERVRMICAIMICAIGISNISPKRRGYGFGKPDPW